MNLLAIDASAEFSSIALSVNDQIFVEEISSQKTHAQLLLPMIDELLLKSNTEIEHLDGIVFGCGPGSFTGLRIACSIAKGLAYPKQLPLYPVSTLAAIAMSVREQFPDASVLSVLDARMQEMYWGYYPSGIMQAEDRLNAVNDINIPQGEELILAGVGIELYLQDFSEAIKAQILQKVTLYPQATSMIKLVKQARINPIAIANAQPIYVRNQVTQGEKGG